MKVNKRSFVVVVVAVVAVLALLSAASAQAPVKDRSASGAANWSALDKVDALKASLEKAGFTLTPGEFAPHDLVQETCTGKIPQAGTNPWPSVTFFLHLPTHPGVTPMPVPGYWQLGEDEAIVLVGQTPPPVLFYSYEVFAISLPGIQNSRGLAVGNSVNIKTIHTTGPDKYNRPVVIIITGNREAERRVRAAVLKAGYPDAMINVAPISPVVAPLGAGEKGSWFAFPHRIAASLDRPALEAYLTNSPYAVFRVKPNQPLQGDPEPVPILRVRGTGHTEMELYPSLKQLRDAILDSYAGMPAEELDTKITQTQQPPDGHEAIAEKPYVALQRGKDAWGASRDNVSLTSSPNFRLREGVEEFAIVYGANHQSTSKATYTSFTLYADKDRWIGLTDGTVTSNSYDGDEQPGDSARRFLCPDNPSQCPDDVQYLYAWKVARHCNGEDFCMELKTMFVDMNGQPYECNLYDWYNFEEGQPLIGPFDLDVADMNITWRTYVEPATNAGPDDNELLYDRAIYFGPYFDEQ
jgi:hypothetical protein